VSSIKIYDLSSEDSLFAIESATNIDLGAQAVKEIIGGLGICCVLKPGDIILYRREDGSIGIRFKDPFPYNPQPLPSPPIM
jgi:hypothetical protein